MRRCSSLSTLQSNRQSSVLKRCSSSSSLLPPRLRGFGLPPTPLPTPPLLLPLTTMPLVPSPLTCSCSLSGCSSPQSAHLTALANRSTLNASILTLIFSLLSGG